MRTLKLVFTEASFADKSDINILWAEGDHGDAYPFDGRKHHHTLSYRQWLIIAGSYQFVVIDNELDLTFGVTVAAAMVVDLFSCFIAGNTSNVLAHTFYPSYQDYGALNGNIHFDDYENWVMDHLTSIGEGVYFPYVLTHEIGHALGLGHSNRQEAIMNPIYKQIPLNSLYLDVDDKCALNWNYSKKNK